MKKEVTEELLAKIKHEFPKLKFSKWRYLDNGEDNQIIVLDDTLVFRFPRHSSARNHLVDEARVLSYYSKKLAVGLPFYEFIDKNKTFGVYKWLFGKEVTPAFYKKMSEKEKNSFAHQLADFLTGLQVLPKSAIKKYHLNIENPDRDAQRFRKDFNKIAVLKMNARERGISERLFNEIENSRCADAVFGFCHGDLTQDHILWDKNHSQLNIIDFSDCYWGDIAVDFAGLYCYGDSFVKKVYKLYKGKKDSSILKRADIYYRRIALLDIYYGVKNNSPLLWKSGLRSLKKTEI